MGPGCEASWNASNAAAYAPMMRELILNISQREMFISRNPHGWVDCPSMDCVGVGYRGRRRIMCFMCEQQWEDPNHRLLQRLGAWLRGIGAHVARGRWGSRPCPHCGVSIQKDGGCPNMRCGLCGQ